MNVTVKNNVGEISGLEFAPESFEPSEEHPGISISVSPWDGDRHGTYYKVMIVYPKGDSSQQDDLRSMDAKFDRVVGELSGLDMFRNWWKDIDSQGEYDSDRMFVVCNAGTFYD